MKKLPRYVVITPARNEDQFIELTITSVVSQTHKPVKWVVVSDGSTDKTDEIVKRYATAYPWIELLRMPERRGRDFAGKVHAFNAGYAAVQGTSYDVIASLDADISFDEDYFAFLLQKLVEDARLGLMGTPFREGANLTYDYRFVNIEHVSGACQVFRRECFEAIGGYTPVKGGCIDHIAVLTARMKGWKTRTFLEKVCQHHRDMGTAQQGIIKARFLNGNKDYVIGNHPLWEMFRTTYQMTKKPLIIGGFMVGCGYFWSMVRQVERPVSSELVSFQRREQMQRLRNLFRMNRASRPQGLATSS
jgi:biofilm PGA synthesis N-glycosyltransferase PgaC